MTTVKKVTRKEAKEILEKLNKRFGNMIHTKNGIFSDKILAKIREDKKIPRGLTERRYKVEIRSGYHEDSTLQEALEEYNKEYFIL